MPPRHIFVDDSREDIKPEGPQEDDWQTDDRVRFYQSGKCVLAAQVHDRKRGVTRDAQEGELSETALWYQIDDKMKQQNWFPDVWFISDHGNAHLMKGPRRACSTSR